MGIFGSEHFGEPFHGFTCAGAPIRGPEGAIIGALDISLGADDAKPMHLVLASYAAHAIELELAGRAAVRADERTQSEQALADSEAQHRQLFETMAQGVVYQAADGPILNANPAAERILGLSLDDLMGRTSADPHWRAVREDGTPFPGDEMPPMEALRTGTEVRDVVLGIYNQVAEEMRWLRVHSFPVFSAGGDRPSKVYTILDDVTDQRRSEEQLRHSQKLETVGRLAGGIAHDFNNLLSVIGGNAALALAQLPPHSPVRFEMEEIARAAEKAADLTRQLLAFSRKQVLQPEPLDLGAVLRSMELVLRQLIGDDIRVEVHADPDVSAVDADRGQIEQVILNLVMNARDALEGSGHLEISVREVEVSGARARRLELEPGCFVQLSVTDSGHGIEKRAIPRIFEPFFTTKSVGQGTGLGLATVHGIVKQSGGGIEVDSEDGRGTCFRVYLACSARQPIDEPHKSPADAPEHEVVLVVEEDDALRALASRILRRAGYEIREAVDGTAALQLLEQTESPITILITDVVMPGMSGRELAERVRARWPDVRVLYTSGYTEDDVVRRGLRQLGRSFLPKPYTPLTLIQRVKEIVEASAGTTKHPV